MMPVAPAVPCRLNEAEQQQQAPDSQQQEQEQGAQVARRRAHNHGIAVHHPTKGYYCISPVNEGRIINVAGDHEPHTAP